MVRHGSAPYLECSTKGDKRFSAFCAHVKRYNGTIEKLYQAAKVFDCGATGLSWREAKGRHPINANYCAAWYAHLWDQYIWENPNLLDVLKQSPGLSDVFGQQGHQCQASELWRIKLGVTDNATDL